MKLLDNYSKVLIGVAILGILASLYSLFFLSINDKARDPADKVATVIRPNNDTRLKRSGDIHWYPVSQNVDAFDEDVIFTGKDSVATIRFNSGGEVTLLPMSLITISKGVVTLNSGTIEVSLEKGAVKVESFGEEFDLKEKATFKVQNTPEVKRITPVAKTKEAEEKVAKILSTNPTVKSYVQTQTLTILGPTTGERLPKFKGSNLNIRWRASIAAPQGFQVDLSSNEDFSSVTYSSQTTLNSLKVPVDELSGGINYFRISDVKSGTKVSSNIFLIENVGIEYLQPSHLADYPEDKVQEQGILFEWTNNLNLAQRIQVGSSSDFQSPQFDETLEATQRNFAIKSEGTYYWRVGHVIDKSVVWANPSSFSISKKIPISPLEFHAIPKIMDFRLTPQYEIKVRDLNKCADYEFTLLKDDVVVSRINSKRPQLRLKQLRDGEYEIKVVGTLESKEKTKEAIKGFVVKNSLPLKAPKIKNKKKVKLYVRLIQEALNFILPSARAAPPAPFYSLEWEETPGAIYEIEVSKTKPENIVLRQKLDTPKFRFVVPGPETFYWRVRTQLNGEWSPFSEFAVVQVEDRIGKMRDVLMVEPEDGSHVEFRDKRPSVEFTWNEPDKRVTYFLEISSRSDGSNARIIKVKNGSHTLSFKKFPKQIFWRVFAESQYKNRSKNSDRYRLTTSVYKEPVKIKKEPKYVLRTAAFMGQSANVMDFSEVNLDKREETLTGPIFELNAEYLPGAWNYRKSVNFYMRYSLLNSSETEFSEQKFGAEFGWLSPHESEVKHNFYAGYHFYDNMNFKFGSDIEGNYLLSFVSARYLYRRPYTEKINFELNLGAQIPAFSFNPLLILRPGINYKLNTKWWIDFYALFERFSHKLEDSEQNNNVKIQYQNMAFGAGMTYFIGD